MNQLRHQNHKNKQLNNALQNKILKVKISRLELSKNFKPINVSIDDMDRLEEKKITKKKTFAKKNLVRLVRLVS